MMVIGAKGHLDVEDALERGRTKGFSLQILDASCVCGKEHLEVALAHARRAFEEKRNVSESMEMEFLRYVSCRRQIRDAIAFAGAKDSGTYAFVFFSGTQEQAQRFVEELGLEIDGRVLEPAEEKIKRFVGERELSTVDKSFYVDLVFEKIAMVSLMK